MANDIGPSQFKADVEAAYSNNKTSDFRAITPGEYTKLKAEYDGLGSDNAILPAATDKAAARAMIFGHGPLLEALSSGASYESYAKSINVKDNPNEFSPTFK